MSGPRWGEVRSRLAALSPGELIDVVHDLFTSSADNRRFLAARLLGAQGPALEEYRSRIQAEFDHRLPRDPRLRLARQAIRDYRKASADAAGTADLMLTYVEGGTAFTRSYGDMPQSFYGSLAGVLHDLDKLLRQSPAVYLHVRQRLLELRDRARHVGWGWGDYVEEVVGELERAFRCD
jgi:hypothetical protein